MVLLISDTVCKDNPLDYFKAANLLQSQTNPSWNLKQQKEGRFLGLKVLLLSVLGNGAKHSHNQVLTKATFISVLR